MARGRPVLIGFFGSSVNISPASAEREPCCLLCSRCQTGCLLTAFGVTALTFMMVMYALERRDARFVLAFACGCVLASAYGFLSGAWPFGVVEAIWATIAARRYFAKTSY